MQRDKLIFGLAPRSYEEGEAGAVPAGTGTAPVSAPLDQAALTSIVLGIAACGVGTLTWSMPFVYFASTFAASTPSGSAKFRWNAPYATSRTKYSLSVVSGSGLRSPLTVRTL